MPDKKKSLINLQWVVVITISYLLFLRQGEVVEDPRVYSLVFSFLISVLVLYRLPPATLDHKSFAYILLIVDTVLISLGILLYRERPWDLFLIFFFGLFIAGIGENLLQIVIGCLIVSIISVILSSPPSAGASALDLDLLLRIPFIFGVTLLYGYLAQQVKREKQANEELARREKALRATLSDLKESHEELKTAQLQLIQAEKLESVGTLAAGVAHEVKNPLAIILQWIHYLSKHLPTDDDNVVMALQEVNNAVRRANSIVKGLLDFSAASELSLTTEELNSVVEQSLSLVKHELDRYHVSAVRELGEDLPPVRLDRNKIEQVFVNIFMNAVHAMPEGGTLTVKAYAKQLKEISRNVGSRKADHFRIGDTVVIAEVEDTGTGIPEDQLSKIFDPFFTTNSTGKGTGLALTVTKQIIDLHGGTINIGNRKGGGVRVSIMFKA